MTHTLGKKSNRQIPHHDIYISSVRLAVEAGRISHEERWGAHYLYLTAGIHILCLGWWQSLNFSADAFLAPQFGKVCWAFQSHSSEGWQGLLIQELTLLVPRAQCMKHSQIPCHSLWALLPLLTRALFLLSVLVVITPWFSISQVRTVLSMQDILNFFHRPSNYLQHWTVYSS